MLRATVTTVAVASIFWAVTANGDVYKWRDDTGRLHYGDSPPVESGSTQDNGDVQSIEAYECETEACQAEEEYLAREAAERHEQTMRWLELRQQEKQQIVQQEQEPDDEETESSPNPPAAVPPVWPFGGLPGAN